MKLSEWKWVKAAAVPHLRLKHLVIAAEEKAQNTDGYLLEANLTDACVNVHALFSSSFNL